MTTPDDRSGDEAAVRAAISARVRAVRAKDVEALMAHYAPEVATFDLVPPLANAGAAAVRARVVEWFGSFQSAIGYELREIVLALSGDVAFDHHVTHVRGTARGGQAVDMWFRETVGYRRREGRWLVTHQHSSVPFDMARGTALLELAP